MIGTLEPEDEDVPRLEEERRRRNLMREKLSSPVADRPKTPFHNSDALQLDVGSRQRDWEITEKDENSWFQLARGQDDEDLSYCLKLYHL